MTIGDTINLIQQLIMVVNRPEIKDTATTVIILFIAGMTLLQISKIQINPWSWIAQNLGRAINREVMDEIKDVRKEINDIRIEQKRTEADLQEEKALQARRRILRSADEFRRGIKFSDEFFTETLTDVDSYERYCENHPDFENSKATNSIALIKEAHIHATKENSLV